MIVNINLITEKVIKVRSEIKICVDVSVKIQLNIKYVKKIMFGILPPVLVRLINFEKALANYW